MCGAELYKFDEKAMSFRHFLCKLNILSSLVSDVNCKIYDAYVRLD